MVPNTLVKAIAGNQVFDDQEREYGTPYAKGDVMLFMGEIANLPGFGVFSRLWDLKVVWPVPLDDVEVMRPDDIREIKWP